MNTTIAKRIIITGPEATDIAQHVTAYVRPSSTWSEVQVLRECNHGCKLYARRRGCITQYALIHSAAYSCNLGRNPETARIPVSIAPKAKPSVTAADDQLLDALGSATPLTAGADPTDELNAHLLGWRADLEATPLPELVDINTATNAIQAGAA